jgi:hypothetical protein
MEPRGLGFYRDPLFPFQIHRIEHLFSQLSAGKRPCFFDQPVRKGRLAVIDMGNDRKVPDVSHLEIPV